MENNPKLENIRQSYEFLLKNSTGYSRMNHSFHEEEVALFSNEIMTLFRKAFLGKGWGAQSLESKKGLEVRCAWGFRLNQLSNFNLKPENLMGIDLAKDINRLPDEK